MCVCVCVRERERERERESLCVYVSVCDCVYSYTIVCTVCGLVCGFSALKVKLPTFTCVDAVGTSISSDYSVLHLAVIREQEGGLLLQLCSALHDVGTRE